MTVDRSDDKPGLIERALGRLGLGRPRAAAPPAPEPEAPRPPPPSRQELTAARDLLCGRAVFDGWIFGVAAAPSAELRAFDVLLRHPSAAEVGRHLLEHGASGGIAYGLCLLYLVDRPAFVAAVPRFRGRPDRLDLQMSGCSPLSEPGTLGGVVAEIESGRYPELLQRLCEAKFPRG